MAIYRTKVHVRPVAVHPIFHGINVPLFTSHPMPRPLPHMTAIIHLKLKSNCNLAVRTNPSCYSQRRTSHEAPHTKNHCPVSARTAMTCSAGTGTVATVTVFAALQAQYEVITNSCSNMTSLPRDSPSCSKRC